MSFYQIRTYIRQNSRRIFLIVVGAILVFVLLQILNQVALLNKEREKEELTAQLQENAKKREEIRENPSMETVMFGSNVNKEKNDINVALINSFCEACNEKKIEEAYDMLSDNCKEVLYPTLESFKDQYYSIVFTEKRNLKIQSWIQAEGFNVYKITIRGDLLSTGGKKDTETVDYYTVVRDGEEEKLNISRYITRQAIDRKTSYNDLDFEVIYKDIYMDYEEYKIAVKNNSSSTVLLDSKSSTTATYLQDKSENKYLSYIHELADEDLKIIPLVQKSFKIKFNKVYNENINRSTEAIVFSDALVQTNGESPKNEVIEIPLIDEQKEK